MKLRLALLAALLFAIFMVGRQGWIVTADLVTAAVVTDIQGLHVGSADFLERMDDLSAQLGRLRILNSTCLAVAECTPSAAITGARYLTLQEKRLQTFEEMANLVDRAGNLADKNSPEADVIKFEFAEKAVEYHRLLPEIDALKDGVPSEIARALEPLH